MRNLVSVFVFSCMLFQSTHGRGGDLERDSLPVFIIRDKELASIVDDFISDAQNIETGPYQSQVYIVFSENIDDHSPDVFYIHIEIEDDTVSLNLSIREQNEHSDSLILYKNPHYHQAFIKHKNVLFRATITSPYADVFNYDMLTDLIKRLPTKQEAFFKEPPPDYYDLNLRGGHPLSDTTLESFYDYDGKTWRVAAWIFENDTGGETVIFEYD